MLTKEEEKFLDYWQLQRLRKKHFLRRFTIGLPLGTMIGVALLLNVFSGWYRKANMELNSDSSLMLVILLAIIGIIVFITIFSAHHRWDRNEAIYQDLLRRREEDNTMQQESEK